MRRTLAPSLLVLGIVLGGCSAFFAGLPSARTADRVLDVAANGTADGPGLAIADAQSRVGELLLVNGLLLIEPDGDAWLCDALGESFPPTCVGPRIRVVHLDPAGLALTAGAGAQWSDAPIQLFGTIRAGS